VVLHDKGLAAARLQWFSARDPWGGPDYLVRAITGWASGEGLESLSASAMHLVATGLPFSRTTCNVIPLTRQARAAMAISTSETRPDDVPSVPLPLCECESAKATLARAICRAVAIASAGFVMIKSLRLARTM
jgi:hypothetical protein